MLFSGEYSRNNFVPDEDAGYELMAKGKKAGCEDFALEIASAKGVDLNELETKKELQPADDLGKKIDQFLAGKIGPEKGGVYARDKIERLFSNGKINED